MCTFRAVISSNGTLTVEGVRRADSGLYGCIAGNMAGLARAQVVVNVSGILNVFYYIDRIS